MKLNKKIIIILIGGVIIILSILFILLSINWGVKINKSVDIDIGGYNQVIKVDRLYKNYLVKDDKYTGRYLKLDMEIENKKDVDTRVSLHKFILLNSKDEEITDCYHDSLLPDNKISGILKDTINGNSVSKGAIYCPTKTKKAKKLKIVVIASGSLDKDMQATYEYKDYYIDLK